MRGHSPLRDLSTDGPSERNFPSINNDPRIYPTLVSTQGIRMQVVATVGYLIRAHAEVGGNDLVQSTISLRLAVLAGYI